MKKILLLSLFVAGNLVSNAQCASLTCFSSLNVSLDETGRAKLHPDMLVFGDHSACSLEIAVFDADGNELLPFDSSVTVDCDLLGDHVVRVRDAFTLTACWSSLNISDMLDVCEGTSATEDLIWDAPYFSNGFLYLNIGFQSDLELSVHDIRGRELYKSYVQQTNEVLDLSFLSPGQVYIVTLVNQNDRHTLKISLP